MSMRGAMIVLEVVLILAGCVAGSYWGTRSYLEKNFPEHYKKHAPKKTQPPVIYRCV